MGTLSPVSVIFVPAEDRPGEARPNQAATPTISVVMASLAERPRLEAVLGYMLPAIGRFAAELIVARADTPVQLTELARVFRGVRFVLVSPSLQLPELLSAGMAEASGHVVALTTDLRAHEDDWVDLLSHRIGIRRPVPGPSATSIRELLREAGLDDRI